MVFLTRILDFAWRASDCEELVGGYSQRDGGCGHVVKKNLKTHPKLSQQLHMI